jgi:hypothetical protein
MHINQCALFEELLDAQCESFKLIYNKIHCTILLSEFNGCQPQERRVTRKFSLEINSPPLCCLLFSHIISDLDRDLIRASGHRQKKSAEFQQHATLI